MVLAAEIAYLAQQPELRLEDDLDISFGLSMEYLAKPFVVPIGLAHALDAIFHEVDDSLVTDGGTCGGSTDHPFAPRPTFPGNKITQVRSQDIRAKKSFCKFGLHREPAIVAHVGRHDVHGSAADAVFHEKRSVGHQEYVAHGLMGLPVQGIEHLTEVSKAKVVAKQAEGMTVDIAVPSVT